MPTLYIGNDEIARNLLASIMLFPDDNDSREMFLIDKFLFMLVENWKGRPILSPMKNGCQRLPWNEPGMTCGWKKFHSYFSNIHQKQSIVKSSAVSRRGRAG